METSTLNQKFAESIIKMSDARVTTQVIETIKLHKKSRFNTHTLKRLQAIGFTILEEFYDGGDHVVSGGFHVINPRAKKSSDRIAFCQMDICIDENGKVAMIEFERNNDFASLCVGV
jgi:hypothetical protein